MAMAVEDLQHTLFEAPAEAGGGLHRVLVAFDGSPSAVSAESCQAASSTKAARAP